MKSGHIEIFVSDPMKARGFYVDVLGFTLVQIQGDQFVWLTLEDQSFLLRPSKNQNRVEFYDQSKIGLVLYTENLKEKRAELESRGLKFEDPDMFEGCLTFQDPDGNWFQLVDPNNH